MQKGEAERKKNLHEFTDDAFWIVFTLLEVFPPQSHIT